jgi:hypothetical protein
MPSGVYVLMWIGIICTLVLGFIYIIIRASDPPTLSRSDRRELERAERRIDELESDRDSILDIAYEHKDVDPSLADIVIDEIKKMKQRDKRTKELH